MHCCYCGFHNDATSHSCNSNLYCFHNKKSLAERMWHCLMDGTLEEASPNKKPGNYPQQTSISKFQLLKGVQAKMQVEYMNIHFSIFGTPMNKIIDIL